MATLEYTTYDSDDKATLIVEEWNGNIDDLFAAITKHGKKKGYCVVKIPNEKNCQIKLIFDLTRSYESPLKLLPSQR